MLSRLVIHDVVLIEKLALPLERGLNVFTGETGAGKSILLDALGLALGGRGDAGLVRLGKDQASVAAEFTLDDDHSLFALAAEHGLSAENPVILRRVIGKDGKSRAWFNDQPVGIGLLRQLGDTLLEIHGQFDTHGLLDPATHRGLLDSFAGLSALQGKVSAAFTVWRDAATAQTQAQDTAERAQAEEDFLRAAVSELEQIAPQPGETETLAERRVQLQHREKIGEALDAATTALDGDKGALAALALAGKYVARIADKAAELPDILTAIDRAAAESGEASQRLAHFMASLDMDPNALQSIEERLFALRALARKHNARIDALPDLQRDLTARLDLLSGESGQLAALARATALARHAYHAVATELHDKRRAAAAKFEKLIARELPPLKLDRARLLIDVAALPETQWGEQGMDKISFLAATNTGSAPGPLQKIASGGELARFMLAMKTVLAAADPVPVLVFDEVDMGIGGAVASAVGQRLAQLAAHVQVLVVTHSPQVAARGAHHMRVAKRTGARAETLVEPLEGGDRREEIARMLAGETVTEAARAAAASLLGAA